MLISNSTRFCADVFGILDETADVDEGEDSGSSHSEDAPIVTNFNKTALLISKEPLNCVNKSAVTGFTITGSEPVNTKRRFLFLIDDTLYKLTTAGQLSAVSGEVTAANVLKNGNNSSTLSALTSVPGFVGKDVYPVIALEAPADSEEFPTVHLKLKTTTSTETLSITKTSPEIELSTDGSTVIITSIDADYTMIGNASFGCRVRLRNEDETWTDWITRPEAADQEATAVQVRLTYKVTTTDGTDSAKCNAITIHHSKGQTVVNGTNADLYSTVADYQVPLQSCYVLVRHFPLVDSNIECYVNFMEPPKQREMLNIGTANGSTQEFVLGSGGVADSNIDVSTLELFAGENPISDFNFNSETSTVSLKATKNTGIFASYDYDYGKETWKKMTLESQEPYTDDETVVSRYSFVLPDSDATNKTLSNIRIRLLRSSGTITNQLLGTGTGKKQLFVLPHRPKPSTITFTDSNINFSFNEDSQILTLTAPKNSSIIISYKWVGEALKVVSYAAGWSVS